MELNPMDKIESLTEKGRSFRNFASFDVKAVEDGAEKTAEGIACVFNRSTVIFRADGIDYNEIIDSRAFDSCDMTDVIFNYNHSGKVIARTRNSTLQLSVEPSGLHISAKLDGTEEGRKIYEEIKGGYIDRMSFAFVVAAEGEDYDQATHTRTIRSIKKLYDVSAVDIPAYNTTSINARSLISLDREVKEKLDSLNEQKRRKLLLLLKIEGGPTYE